MSLSKSALTINQGEEQSFKPGTWFVEALLQCFEKMYIELLVFVDIFSYSV